MVAVQFRLFRLDTDPSLSYVALGTEMSPEYPSYFPVRIDNQLKDCVPL
jgi:hypothetical protein